MQTMRQALKAGYFDLTSKCWYDVEFLDRCSEYAKRIVSGNG